MAAIRESALLFSLKNLARMEQDRGREDELLSRRRVEAEMGARIEAEHRARIERRRLAAPSN